MVPYPHHSALCAIAGTSIVKIFEGIGEMGFEMITYHVLFFLDLETRRVSVAGITPPHRRLDAPNGAECDGRELRLPTPSSLILHDRDSKFCAEFRKTLEREV
jgi:hypothetical protein